MLRILLFILAFAVLAIAALAGLTYVTGRSLPAAELEAAYLNADTDRFVDVAGARVRVREEGPQNAAETIVLLHGFTSSLESFDAWAADLSQDYRVVRYDLLGHGLTGPDPSDDPRYAIPERVAFLGEVLDALNIDRAVLAGNSLGGAIAWRYAADHPERVDGLVLISAAAFALGEVGDEPGTLAFHEALAFRYPTPFVASTFAKAVYADVDALPEGRIEVMRDMMRREGNGEAFLAHIDEFTLPDPTADLQRVSDRALVLWGEGDAFMAVAEHGERMVETLSDACLEVVEGAAHVAHEDKPEETLAVVRAFLEGGCSAVGGGQG